jgi:hypothetical protein
MVALVSLSSLIAMDPGSPKDRNREKYKRKQQKHEKLKYFPERRQNGSRSIQYTPPSKKK